MALHVALRIPVAHSLINDVIILDLRNLHHSFSGLFVINASEGSAYVVHSSLMFNWNSYGLLSIRDIYCFDLFNNDV